MNERLTLLRLQAFCVVGVTALTLIACGDSKQAATTSAALPSPSAGQVAPATATPKVSFYAASRFAEQASFGPTPALVAELQAKGFEKWIDEQLALPPSLLDESVIYRPAAGKLDDFLQGWLFNGVASTFVAAPDQLRTRLSWSMSQFVVVSFLKIDTRGIGYWFNLLQRHALDPYTEFLYRVSIAPSMGAYLDNAQNRPKSAECSHCAPNENFARELMQLFTIGVVRLKPDGTLERDARGRLIETYTQRDVDELARALTGWQFNPVPAGRPDYDWRNDSEPMTPSTWPPERDSGRKQVLGRVFPAGQDAPADLRDALDLLTSHGNAAPFIALRLIQHLVKSNPTPGYVARVAAVFRDNGRGVRGDMKALVKTVLLDAEARAGDDPARVAADDGKLREPLLHFSALHRALGCQRATRPVGNFASLPTMQYPLQAQSVFSYYAPTDRTPGSNLLAPEERLLGATELARRFGFGAANNHVPNLPSENPETAFQRAGCDLAPMMQAWNAGPAAYAAYLGKLLFRGQSPPQLERMVRRLAVEANWRYSSAARSPYDRPLAILSFVSGSPFYGAIL